MVLWHKNTHIFPNDFTSVSLAFFNRYPNPYASHVLSIDTLERRIDSDGNLHTVRLIKKKGKLPRWVRPLLNNISDSWIVEFSVVDPRLNILKTYTKNLDHTRIIKVEEFTDYQYDKANEYTSVNSMVKFSSGFRLGIKNKIENWSLNKFNENIINSRRGMSFVMKKIKERTLE
ncbi:hypothetical protein TPHA_0F03060 [Tetrapisispora phaffii CBS 4417]|uniref:PRELI/MSF1 domain-containing protein n=1 Tax=Tetrapisispora phaffii (strain ATCC 24235 / CBS 4417 / NBRC 1672 / NRRL Y-8282 / UCD 70-5) TaxID=1071381 RepID=G8BUK1_TETPH|nr:hypothetical protein TPHA_0F03060 [Tetrapisispora phaffii CBS 4417]CCE63787.1 hypothetical protein TPHA_0F03060 [Tetrapisispora phaffii CBS 4417]